MDHKWVRCDDLDVAAAFGTIGVPLKTSIQVRSDTGKEYVTVFLGTESAVNPALKTATLKKMLEDGTLKKADPEHPLLYALEGIKNLHSLRHSIKTSKRVILVKRKGTGRCAYVSETATNKTLDGVERFLKGL